MYVIAKELDVKLITCYSIIKNEKYLGIFQHNKKKYNPLNKTVLKTIKNKWKLTGWEKLTTQEIFDKCEERLIKNRKVDRKDETN